MYSVSDLADTAPDSANEMLLDYIFVAGSGILSISIALNALSTHAICTAVFVAIGAIVGFVFSSIRTLGKITLLAWAGCGSIIIASRYQAQHHVNVFHRANMCLSVLVVTIAVGIQDRPAAAPQQGPWSSDWKLVGEPTFTEAISAIGSIVFAYAGTPAFFSIVAEMKDPRQYTKALVVCQSTITVVYIVIGIVVYYFCGSYVASPALGSAGVTMKKVCYGLALPGLCIGTVLLCHVCITPVKYEESQMLTLPSASSEIRFRSCSSWFKTSDLQHKNTLDDLAKLYIGNHPDILHHRECNSCFWWSCLTGRGIVCHSTVIPPICLHVAIRQLASRQEQTYKDLGLDGRMVCLCHRLWDIVGCRWNIRLCRQYCGQLQEIRRLGCLDMQGQFWFCVVQEFPEIIMYQTPE